jgi:nucleotide-binding universal stress UspA family protein
MPGILLTTDLSDESKRAFAPVRELAKRLQLDVTLLAVMEEPLLGAAPGGVFAQFPDRERVRADWQRSLDRAAGDLGRDVCKQTLVGEGADVARAICTAAAANGMSYIAMATHGRSGLRRLLLGSVAEAVVRHATVPVLLYPPSAG